MVNIHINRLKRLLKALHIYRPIKWIYQRIWLREPGAPYHLSTVLNLFSRRVGIMWMTYPPFRGYFDHLNYSDGVLSISGWMSVPGLVLDEFRIELNRVTIGRIKPHDRGDVFRGAPMAKFRLEIPLSEFAQTLSDCVYIDIFGLIRDKKVARLSTMWRPDYRDLWAEPPGKLMQRTIAGDQTSFYWLIGLQSFSEYYKRIERHCEVKKARRLL